MNGSRTPGPEERIGPYKLLRPIGRGGMGTVYLAVREDVFTKQVAIKLLAHGNDSAAIVRRFERERQILAHLEHPGIARLLDGGSTEDGRPYFVMEYVEGDSLHHYCARNGLSVSKRLELFRRICSAVSFAHRSLVVHRDLKPGNILVTAEGEPKLLDFGIAKVLQPEESSEDSEVSRQAMTPAYASPEQLLGEPITTASDVFSLGVLLHELATGERPKPSSLHYILPATSLERPQDPEARRQDARTVPALTGDLNSIVSKALSLKPGLRYSSVEQLSEDVGHYLAGRPILARAGDPAYRARLFLRRYAFALAVTAIVLLLVAGFAFHARRQIAELDADLEAARDVAVILGSQLADGEPYLTESALSPRERLDRGLDEIRPRFGDRPDVKAELLEALALAYTDLGGYQEAVDLEREALDLRKEHLGEDHPDVAAGLIRLAASLRRIKEYHEAEIFLRRGLALTEKHSGEGYPDPPRWWMALGEVLERQGRTSESAFYYRKVRSTVCDGSEENAAACFELERKLGHLRLEMPPQGSVEKSVPQ